MIRTLVEEGVTRILLSYFWVRNMSRERAVAKVQADNPSISFFLDSGAFSYAQQIQTRTMPPPEQFFRRYMAYLKDYGAAWDRIVEPDFDGIDDVDVSVEQVDRWRGEMHEAFPSANIVPVYHSWRQPEAWARYVADPRVKSLAIGRAPPWDGEARRMIDQANQAGKPVHGLAMTKYNTKLRFIPYDSVDSSTWVSGQKYGNIYIYQGGKILNLTKANRGEWRAKGYQAYFRARGCDPKKIIAGDQEETLRCNIRTWKLIGDHFEQLRKKQGLQLETDSPPKERRPFPTPR